MERASDAVAELDRGRAPGAVEVEHRLDKSGIYDGAASLPGSAVLGDDGAFVDDADAGVISADMHSLSDEAMRDGV